MSSGKKKQSFIGDAVHACRRCLSIFIHLAPPDLPPEVTNLLASLQMTNRDVDILYRTFQQLRQHDPITVSTLPTEVCSSSVLYLVRTRKEWVEGILQRLLELGGHSNVIPWESFLYVLLNFCQLSKVELCQVLFFIISKEMKSWTVHHLTCAQLEEFYEKYERCEVKSFNTAHIQFARLPLAKYTMYEFVELTHRYGVLINPLLHLQRSIQQALPSLRFWSDYDRVEVFNREIAIDFFRIQKCQSILDIISGAGAKEVIKQLEGAVGIEIGAHEDRSADLQGKGHENAPLLLGSESFLPLPYLPGGLKHPPPKHREAKEKPAPAWMQKHNKANEDPQTGVALGSAVPSLARDGRPPPEVAKLIVTFYNATGLPIPTHSYATCEIDGRPQTRVKTAVVWGTEPVWNEVHEIYGYVVGENKGLDIKILDNSVLVKHILPMANFYPFGFDAGLPYPGGTLRMKIEVTLPKTVKDAEDMIKSTFCEEARMADKGFAGAQMAQQLALAKETLSTLARVQELDFIAKSRQNREKRDNIVNIIGRSANCELIERPVPKIFGLFR
mmetsp:Transcript_108117/g.187648  ORF Transcript_108117/g.187648 Transcript_108117/m.187648 type:complete len:558 (-) Transcript_108117:112-1785(-)